VVVGDELRRLWKEVIVAYFEVLIQNMLGRIGKS
jgi:hypothetical protein